MGLSIWKTTGIFSIVLFSSILLPSVNISFNNSGYILLKDEDLIIIINNIILSFKLQKK